MIYLWLYFNKKIKIKMVMFVPKKYMFKKDEFYKYAIKHRGISSLTLHRYQSRFLSSMTPYIIEERQLNVA